MSNSPLRLHIGSGRARKEGWTNIDIARLPGVDHVLDVRGGLPFRNVSRIFAEHFIEHLTFDEGVEFLRECRRVLAPDGILRLSTPNLDWVWTTQYHPHEWNGEDEAVRECFGINRGFSGWGHRFLWNRQTLAAVLRSAGFGEVVTCSYGESIHPDLQDLEEHELYPDFGEIPHVIVLEASGVASPHASAALQAAARDYQEAFDPLQSRFIPRWSSRVRRALRRVLGRSTMD